MDSSQSSNPVKAISRPKSQNASFDDKPLWNHVTILSIPKGGGGNRVWTCNYCSKKVTGSFTKVKAYLLKISNQGVEVCKVISDDILQTLKKENEQAELQKEKQVFDSRRKIEYVSLPPGSDLLQHKKRKGPLEKAFNVIERDEADKEVARMFYTGGIPFNFARNPHFIRYSQILANSNLSGYVPPTYNRLRTSLLAQERTHINFLLQPIRDSWKKKGASICSDGWGDRQKRPLINIMVASHLGPMFVKAIDTSGNIKDAEFVAKIFIEAVEQIGKENVVQIVTDNATNFKAAGLIIEAKYPHIFWTPCVVHSLNLALKSMCEPTEKSLHYSQCKWIKELLNDIQETRNFIMNHGMALSIFCRYSKLKLLKVAETRFASSIVMAKRLKEVKASLEQMVMDPDWKTFRANGKSPIEIKAMDVKECIVSDRWWDKIDYFLSLTKPIVDMLRAADKDAPVLHLIYDMWDTMIESVKAIIFAHEGEDMLIGQSNFFDAIHDILESRWNKSNTPLHCMAHSLVPKYYAENWLQGGSNGASRQAPNEDEEVSLNRDKCFRRLFSNDDDFRKVLKEYGIFSSSLDYFNQPHVMAARVDEDPISWWANYGASTPLLQSLAYKLLSQPASSSCCERNWSTYSFIQNIKRNQLTAQRSEDLVYIHSNLRLLSRKNENYTKGTSKYWDIGGDNFSVEENNWFDVANLSIDDPDMEAMIFDEEED